MRKIEKTEWRERDQLEGKCGTVVFKAIKCTQTLH
jgi:hypothetical protein